jgi:hypothetical protein
LLLDQPSFSKIPGEVPDPGHFSFGGKMRIRIASLLIVLAVCSTIVWSQGTTSRITGLVSDKSGAVVASANVTVTNEGTNTSYRTTSGDGGFYVLDSLQIGTYTISVEAKGFKKFVSTGNVLSIGAPTTVNAALEVGTAGETVEVKGGYDLVQTDTSGNFGTVIDNASLTQLPIVGVRGRNPLNLVTMIPGVQDAGLSTGGGTSIHGSRDRAWNYTLDGIDSNETSAGGSQLSPTRVNPDSLSEFRVLTGNFTAEYGRNSGGQVAMVTKSGTNDIHGTGFWFYQSPFLNANNPDVKASQLAKNAPNIRPQFVQNIYGGSVGGPIIKNKTFFFANVQLLHALNSPFLTRTVYTDAAKRGLFRYVVGGTNGAFGSTTPSVDANGNVLSGLNIGTYDIVANDPLKIGLDPAMQKFLALAPSPNNFTAGDGLNTAGYSFTSRQLEKQVDLTFKIDHTINANQSVFVRWGSGHQNTIGDTANAGSPRFPGLPDAVDTLRSPRNLAINWRWNPSPTTTNEVVVGMNRFGFVFDSPSAASGASTPFVTNLVTNPLLTAGGNTRVLTTYQLVDNFTLAKSAHTYRWGVNLRYTRHIDHRFGIGNLNALPQVTFDTGTNAVDLNTFQLCNPTSSTCPNSKVPGINNTDRGNLQSAINDLLGRIGQIQQGYAAQDLNTFKPAGSFNLIDSRWPEYDFYVQDTWKLRRNITLDLGLRLEARLAPYLTNFPNLVPNQPVAFGLVPSGNLQWVKGDYYHNDWNNLGPSIGFAWDPFEDGKTSLRANYRLAYDRINTFSFSSTVFQGLPGLTTQITDTSSGQSGLRAKDWKSPVPTKSPAALTLLDPFSVNSVTVADPNMRTPKVNMWGLSIQREIAKNTVFSLTYNGRHGVGLYGGYDANQVNYTSNGFLDAFNIVRAGGESPLFEKIFSKDSRTKLAGETGSAFARRNYATLFSRGSVAGLALAISQRLQPINPADPKQGSQPLLVFDGMPATFFQPYPQILGGLNVLDTRDYSIYHGMEAQIERRFSSGLLFQFSFTWSKSEDTRSYDPTFTTVAGTSTSSATSTSASSQSAAATSFDNRNPRLNWGPSDFDHTRVWQSNWVYELPFGKGKRWGSNWSQAIDQIIGGWEVAGNFIWESGRPITLYAGSTAAGSTPGATFSSDTVTPLSCFGNCDPYLGHAYFDATKGQQFFMNFQPFDSTTNCAVSTDGKTKLCIPAPGQFSNIGRNYFRQGIFANVNATIAKTFQVTEHQSLQARLEMQNVTNSQMYDTFGSQSLQSSVFMRLNPAADGVLVNSPRRMQLSLKYTF